jgi:hypothetical protein
MCSDIERRVVVVCINNMRRTKIKNRMIEARELEREKERVGEK